MTTRPVPRGEQERGGQAGGAPAAGGPDRRAIGGVVGPLGFIAAWVIDGWRTAGYDPLDDAISELAAVDAPTQVAMTLGFVVFGLGVGTYAFALRRQVAGPAWIAALVAAVATLAVGATPLDAGVDTLHGVAAGTGYVALALTPLLASRTFRAEGRSAAADWSVAAGTVAALALAATVVGGPHGFLQRLGLTAADAWLVGSAIWMLRRPAVVAAQGAAGTGTGGGGPT